MIDKLVGLQRECLQMYNDIGWLVSISESNVQVKPNWFWMMFDKFEGEMYEGNVHFTAWYKGVTFVTVASIGECIGEW